MKHGFLTQLADRCRRRSRIQRAAVGVLQSKFSNLYIAGRLRIAIVIRIEKFQTEVSAFHRIEANDGGASGQAEAGNHRQRVE